MGCTSCGGNKAPIRQRARQRRVNQRGGTYGRKKAIVYNERVHGGHEALKPISEPEPVIEDHIAQEITPPQEEPMLQEEDKPSQEEESNP